MKNLSFIFILISLQGLGQSYTAIHVIGKIYDTNSGAYITKGSKIDESSSLKFETPDARAAVLSSTRGRFVIQKNQTADSQSDAAYALASVISPVRGRLSTRAGSINNTLDFQKHFNEGTIALLGDSYRVGVSPSAFYMSDSQFFYAQYEYQNERINKKLEHEGDQLIIFLEGFYSIDGQPVNPQEVKDVKLFYYNSSDGSSRFITEMDVAYVSDDTLQTLVSEFPENTAEAVTDFIFSMYGKCTQKQVAAAIANL